MMKKRPLNHVHAQSSNAAGQPESVMKHDGDKSAEVMEHSNQDVKNQLVPTDASEQEHVKKTSDQNVPKIPAQKETSRQGDSNKQICALLIPELENDVPLPGPSGVNEEESTVANPEPDGVNEEENVVSTPETDSVNEEESAMPTPEPNYIEDQAMNMQQDAYIPIHDDTSNFLGIRTKDSYIAQCLLDHPYNDAGG